MLGDVGTQSVWGLRYSGEMADSIRSWLPHPSWDFNGAAYFGWASTVWYLPGVLDVWFWDWGRAAEVHMWKIVKRNRDGRNGRSSRMWKWEFHRRRMTMTRNKQSGISSLPHSRDVEIK